MSDNIELNADAELFPAEDYKILRERGLEWIEKTGRALWTDYNSSDPGITILEALCYAITDLAYRTRYDIKDILAPETLSDDTWSQVFYTAREIFYNAPLSFSDYRKLIVDVDGVRNAMIEKSQEYEVPVYVNRNSRRAVVSRDCLSGRYILGDALGKLTIKQVFDSEMFSGQDQEAGFLDKTRRESGGSFDCKGEIVEIKGLYEVIIVCDDDIVESKACEKVRKNVFTKLLQNRNLCEDFLDVKIAEYQDLCIDAEIEVENDLNVEEVLAEIFFIINEHLNPSVKFYAFDQMVSRGYQVDEIFDGPTIDHGFIDPVEFKETEFFRDVKVSDIIRIVCDVKGVKAVRNLQLFCLNYENKKAVRSDIKKCYCLSRSRKVGHIVPMLSKINIVKQNQYTEWPDKQRGESVLKRYKDMKARERHFGFNKRQKEDCPVPVGEFMDIKDYYPVTQSLPLCYGVNEKTGPPSDPTRYAQAMQLKGYLLFFEQILSDYQVQLSQLKELFTYDESVSQTYYSRVINELDQIKSLLCDNDPEQFRRKLQELVESQELFMSRRNRFLDHMLARFGEDMSEYEQVSRFMSPRNVDERMIKDKINVLKNKEYSFISSNRGRGFDYSAFRENDLDRDIDSHNVSGLERRVAHLLGFKKNKSGKLSNESLVSEPVYEYDTTSGMMRRKRNHKGEFLNIIRLKNPSESSSDLLVSDEVVDGYCTDELMNTILTSAGDYQNYLFKEKQMSRNRNSGATLYWFELRDGKDPETSALLAKSKSFRHKYACLRVFMILKKEMKKINENEGFHLVEHILLRPKVDEIDDESGYPLPISLLDIFLDPCDIKEASQKDDTPSCRKRVYRVPAKMCYDKMNWVLEYSPCDSNESLLFQNVIYDEKKEHHEYEYMRFGAYRDLDKRICDLQEYGSDRNNYEIIERGVLADEDNERWKSYSFIIRGAQNEKLAQSRLFFDENAVNEYVDKMRKYFCYEFDESSLEQGEYDYNADPYSFRTTMILPSWPKRFRDPVFRRLVEKTIKKELPAHIYPRIVWVGICEMQRFEKAYFQWRREMSENEYPAYDKCNPLVDSINALCIAEGYIYNMKIWSFMRGGFNAVVNGKGAYEGKLYIFKGDECVRYDWKDDKADTGYPKLIADKWRGLPNGFMSDFDAAVNGKGAYEGKLYIFKGDEYIRYDWKDDKADTGYPKLIADKWRGLPNGFMSDFDAAVNGKGAYEGKLYIFKGDEYVRYDWKDDKADTGYPRLIADRWHGLPKGFRSDFDAAVNGKGAYEGKLYIFKGEEYIRYDWKTDKVDDGYPKKIVESWRPE